MATPPEPAGYSAVEGSAEFRELRRSYRVFAFPVTVGFISWYLLYVLLSSFADDFMSTKLVGHLNVAFFLGIAQFVTTFLIAWLYARYADRRLDPLAGVLKSRLEGGGPPDQPQVPPAREGSAPPQDPQGPTTTATSEETA
ncbi:DUF485 domain-containing protein [Streptomyces sp. NBC_01476]|nr:DUF485 domain-containing protein [Streptomyces sp. NBC_01476]